MISIKKFKSKIPNKKELLIFLSKIGTEFIDTLIKSIKPIKKHEIYKIYSKKNVKQIYKEKNNDNYDNNNNNIANDLIEIIYLSNLKIKKNINDFKLRLQENKTFGNNYKKFKQFNPKLFGAEFDNPEILFKDLIRKYQENKDYKFSQEFLKKNIFNESPLLILSLKNLVYHFSIEGLNKGFNSLSEDNSILFLTKLNNELNNLRKNIEKLNISNINDLNKKNVIDTDKIFDDLNFYINNIKIYKKENKSLYNLIEKTEKYYELKRNNSQINLNKNNIFNYESNISNNSNSLPKIITDEDFNKIKYKNRNIIKRKLNKLSNSFYNKSKNSQNSTNYINDSSLNISNKNFSMGKISEYDIFLKRRKSIDNLYEKLKNYQFILHDYKNNTIKSNNINETLKNFYNESEFKNFNSKKISFELYNKYNLLKDKINEIKIKKLMNNKNYNKINLKIKKFNEINNKLKDIDLNLINVFMKQKIKNIEN